MCKYQRQIKVPTKVGVLSVPATKATEEIPNLAVTMTTFGTFEVTHVPSGFLLVGDFERAVNAFVAMAQIQLALNEMEIDSSQSGDLFKSDIMARNRELESLGMTFRQWVGLHKTIGCFSGEFPWENSEEGPHAELEKLISQLKG
ncbi:hypothetical protein AB6D94_07715 [Vibrio sp. 10N.247.310.56]|uniref:hypothetical protein n=1 Tax=Vibrio sp. 10N.247.310.56 TaxID=3229980 RepID=UPI003552E727